MVYYGKPSKGCASCRKRKIKCDQLRPTCMQCQRGGFSCSGYRDTTTLHFRDQSQEVIRRAQRPSSSNRQLPSPSTSPSTHPDQDIPQERCAPRVSNPPKVPLMEQSICIFLHNYVLDDSAPGKVHLTSSQIVSHATSSQGVRYAMSAIGLAILANMQNTPSLVVEARANYAKALQLTNTALRNKNESLQDTTLNSVLLLGMFEVMSCGAPKSLENWQKHIAGAAAFLEMWDSQKVCSLTGMQLFTQLRTELMANCLRTQTHIPQTMRKLSGIVQFCKSEQESRVEQLVNLIAEVSDLLADVKGGGVPDPVKAIGRAHSIDKRLRDWTQSLPVRWQYVLRSSQGGRKSLLSELSFNDYYHIYSDLWACNVWSYCRNARILLNLLIRDRLLVYLTIEPYPEWKTLLGEARANIERLSVDIFLSVPFSIAIQFASLQHGQSHTRQGGCLGGYYILWPLYVAASVQALDTPLRKWAAGCLRYIGRSMGIGQALLMARVITGELPPAALSVFDYCHSYSSEMDSRRDLPSSFDYHSVF